SSVLAIDGLPAITVPAGYGKLGVPFGLCFSGLRGYEPRLIEMAYAFEHVTMEKMKEIGQTVFLVAENTTGIGASERVAISQL
uniref:Amidase domain-containing protein n=1 Tax=Aegilops tauschii subsp. strangulata TaxID=200361 RepID=A0A453A9W7_AEGTS